MQYSEFTMSKYFERGVVCLYLDQDASSRICAAIPENDRWKLLKSLIETLHARKRIVIPLSLEHLLETSGRRERAPFHDQEMRRLSRGYGLRAESEIVAGELIVLARSRKLRRSDYFGKNLARSLAADKVLSQVSELNARYSRVMEVVHSFPNKIKEISRKHNSPPLNEQLSIVESRLQHHVHELIGSLAQVEMRILPRRRHFEAAGVDVTRWNDELCRVLAAGFSMMPNEAALIKEALKATGMRGVPTLYSRFKLSGVMDIRSLKLDVHDAYDVSRAACALPSADIMIVDSGMASLIRELKLDKEFQTEVFSCKEHDGSRLEAKLSSLL